MDLSNAFVVMEKVPVAASKGPYGSQTRRIESLEAPQGPHPDDEFYNMSHQNRGIALIFNHLNFDDSLYKPRKGTDFDRDVMEKSLKVLGFHVEVYNDYTRSEIMDALQIVTKMDHSNSDCLVVTILSHGTSYGRICARDGKYNTNDVISFFSGSRCPSLAGKPKLFFIQACRGERTDSGVTIRSDSGRRDQMLYTIPNMADILIMYATVEGYFAWRDTSKGGCFIQSLAKLMIDHYKTRDLLTILTLVNRAVAIGFESAHVEPELDQKKEMCSIVSMLTRLLRF